MSQAIGFATQFYTLWSIDTTPKYITDSYGKHWLVGYDVHYTYHKNISTDLDKAKSLYPDLDVREDLRGITASWTKANKDDLCPNIMKFGKYAGYNLDELVNTDFKYILWMVANSAGANAKYAREMQAVKDHFAAIEKAENDELQAKDDTFKALIQAGEYTLTPDRNLKIHDDFAYLTADVDGVFVTFIFNDFSYNEYNGHSYGLPMVKGKAKRIKGKSITVKFSLDTTDVYQVKVTDLKVN